MTEEDKRLNFILKLPEEFSEWSERQTQMGLAACRFEDLIARFRMIKIRVHSREHAHALKLSVQQREAPSSPCGCGDFHRYSECRKCWNCKKEGHKSKVLKMAILPNHTFLSPS